MIYLLKWENNILENMVIKRMKFQSLSTNTQLFQHLLLYYGFLIRHYVHLGKDYSLIIFSYTTDVWARSVVVYLLCHNYYFGQHCYKLRGFPGGSVVKNLPAMQETGFNPWVKKIPWKRKWQPTPVYFPGEPHGQRNLVGHSPCSY